MALDDILSILLSTSSNQNNQGMADVSQTAMAGMQENLNPFALGTYETKTTQKRQRIEIYTKWERMLRFAPIAEAMGIHVAAALGGDPATSQQVFITPSPRLRGEKLSTVNKAQLEKLEKRIKPMERLINQHIIKICRDAVGFGDAYTRVYGVKNKGVIDLLANEFTYPPLVQAYEQLNKTVAFQVLDAKNWRKELSKLSKVQMVRMKMPRVTTVPQLSVSDAFYVSKTLQEDDPNLAPIVPAHVGGSFCAEVEEFYDNIVLILSSMNSQQIADSVKQQFLSMNMSAMSPAQRKAYIASLQTMLLDHEKFIKNALNGGDAIYSTKFHVLPTANEKQSMTSVGDLAGTRSSSVNTEGLMINVRLLMGGLGMDPSMVGWADMLSGGLGDGAYINQSAQCMRRHMNIRTAAMMIINEIIALDWGYAYGEAFDDPLDYPWQIEFYSDQTAAMSETLSNQQKRANLVILKAEMLNQIKELGLSVPVIVRILERDGGMDYDEAMLVAQDLKKQAEVEQQIIRGEQTPNQPEEDDEQSEDDEDGI